VFLVSLTREDLRHQLYFLSMPATHVVAAPEARQLLDLLKAAPTAQLQTRSDDLATPQAVFRARR
jgi:hypothetical protein